MFCLIESPSNRLFYFAFCIAFCALYFCWMKIRFKDVGIDEKMNVYPNEKRMQPAGQDEYMISGVSYTGQEIAAIYKAALGDVDGVQNDDVISIFRPMKKVAMEEDEVVHDAKRNEPVQSAIGEVAKRKSKIEYAKKVLEEATRKTTMQRNGVSNGMSVGKIVIDGVEYESASDAG